MVQIIKATHKLEPFKPRSKIIKREEYEETIGIQNLEADTEEQRKKIIAAAKEQANLAKEQAMQAGADQAFAEAAQMAVDIFSNRAKICLDLKGAMERLVAEIAQKILGAALTLDKTKQDAACEQGITKMRARRKLKIQFTHLEQLATMKQMPDFEIETASDVPEGFVRIVTEVGSALWAVNEASPVFYNLERHSL